MMHCALSITQFPGYAQLTSWLLYPSGKSVSVTKELFQPTKETPIQHSLLILTNPKDNETIDLIHDNASLIHYCSTYGLSQQQ